MIKLRVSFPTNIASLAETRQYLLIANNLNLVERKKREDEFKKPPVPKRDEKPIHGLVSDKNFIVANAVENILAAPNLPASKDKDYLKKKNFGKVPKYLTKIKNEIEDEYNLVREMQVEEQNEKDR